MKKFVLIVVVALLVGCGGRGVSSNIQKYTHELTSKNQSIKNQEKIIDIEKKLERPDKTKVPVIKINDIYIQDFIRLVMTEVLKSHYVMDQKISDMNQKIDIEISAGLTGGQFFNVFLSTLEKAGIMVDEIDGVLIMTAKIIEEKGNDNKGIKAEKKELSDNVYTYKPIHARAEDMKVTLSGVISAPDSKIITHAQSNRIIIKSTEKEKRAIVKLLRILDEHQKQVGVECTIAEVSLTGEMSLGFESFLKTNHLSISAGLISKVTYGLIGEIVIGDWLKVLMQQGEKDGVIRIHSNPYLIIADGAESIITVGSEYPILRQQQAKDDASIISGIEYRKTGIILKIVPTISSENIHISSMIEMSEGQKNTISDIQSPAILTRRIESRVVARSEDTIVIGGLISSGENETTTFGPGLKKLGLPFGKSSSVNRTELVILITAKIIKNDAAGWFEQISKKYQDHEFKNNGVKSKETD